jgi:putative protease
MGEVLGVYGELGMRARTVVVTGLGEAGVEGEEGFEVPFIPRRDLKALKSRVAARLAPAYEAFLEERKGRAVRALGLGEKEALAVPTSPSALPLPPGRWENRRFAVKIDRLEYLDLLDEYLDQVLAPWGEREGEGRAWVEEVVFEPKRMFLAAKKPDEGIARLLAFGRRHRVRVRLALPTVVRAWDAPPVRAWVEAFAAAQEQAGQGDGSLLCFEVGNLGAWGLLEEYGLLPASSSGRHVDVTTDFTLYSLNSQASAVWARSLGASLIALSVEDDAANLEAHMRAWPRAMARVGGDVPAAGDEGVGEGRQAGSGQTHAAPQYILYKDVPLFMAEACSLTALHGNQCPGSKVCGYRTLSIENEQGEKFEVAHEHCKSIVYSTNAQSLVHRQQDLLGMGIRHFRLDFLTRKYEKQHLFEVLDAALRREADDTTPLPDTHQANFDRRLL